MSLPVHKQRRGTAANMAAANELPAPGQIYFELDTNRVKIGDGTTRYNDLPYLDLKSISQLPGLQAALDGKVASTDPRLTDARSPTAHDHDALYYRDAEVDSLLAAKVGQDDARLTNSRTPTSHAASHAAGQADEITPAAIGAAPSSHTHDDRYFTETEVTSKIAASEAWSINTFLPYTGLSAVLTNGYYSKTDTDTLLAGKQNTGNYIVEGDARLTNSRTPTSHAASHAAGQADAITPAAIGAAPSTHNHDDRYYTETETNTLLAGKQATGNYSLVGHTHPLSSLEQSSATTGQVVTWSGSAWEAQTPVTGGGTFTGGTLTSQLVLAGNTNGIDLSFTGSPTTGIRLRAADSIALMTTSADRLVVTSGGSIGFGGVPGHNWNLQANRGISETGGTLLLSPTVSSAMTTGVAYGVFTQVGTATGSNVTTLYANFVHEVAAQRLGTVGSQIAYMVAPNWVGGATSFGFRSDIPEGSGRYNFYAGGTALNQFVGMTLLSGGARVRAGTSNSVLGLAFENDTNTGMWSPLADNLVAVTNGVERLRLDESGRCRISTGSSDLSAYSLGMDDLIVGDGVGGRGMMISSSNIEWCSIGFTYPGQLVRGYVMYRNGSDYMRFGTAAVERMRISSTGNVGIGIGDADSAHRLHVNGTIRATDLTDGTTTRTVTDLLACVKQSDVDASISALVDAAPATLNTLNELAAALNDDPSFATTVTNLIAAKVGSNTTQAGAGTAVNNMVVISQAAYNALATKDSNTVYLLFDAGTPPNAATSLTATAGNAQLSLSWTAPSAPGTSAITDYVVEYTPSGGSASTVNTNSTSTSYTLTGLTNGTVYTVRVAAISAVGTGDFGSSVAVTPSVPVTDPDFASVSLLLHMDGSGATFTDSSGTPKTITASGGATQSTAASKFGGKSLLLNGSSDGISLADLGLGTGDFTIEMFFKTNSSVQYAQLIGNESPDYPNPGFSLLINNSTASGGQIAFYSTGLIASTPSGDYSDDQWHHIAIVNSGGSVSMYIDGDRKATGALSANMNGVDVWIGRNNTFGPRNVVGYIDEVRVTTVARYSGQTISVPTAAFPDSGPPSAFSGLIDYLVVAGGGGASGARGGAGGAGGFRSASGVLVEQGDSLVVTVGGGGVGSTDHDPAGAGSGASSGFGSFTATGGGGGGGQFQPGLAGGSGGGGWGNVYINGGAGNTPSVSPSQGNNGGAGANASPAYGAGGGGGAGGAGSNGTSSTGGNGGAGAASSISGASVTYAGGGGGGVDPGYTGGSGGAGGGGSGVSSGNGGSGTQNLGGGGGGGAGGAGPATGGSGGSGVVIIRVAQAAASTTGSPTVTTDGSDTVYTFTGSGSITF